MYLQLTKMHICKMLSIHGRSLVTTSWYRSLLARKNAHTIQVIKPNTKQNHPTMCPLPGVLTWIAPDWDLSAPDNPTSVDPALLLYQGLSTLLFSLTPLSWCVCRHTGPCPPHRLWAPESLGLSYSHPQAASSPYFYRWTFEISGW